MSSLRAARQKVAALSHASPVRSDLAPSGPCRFPQHLLSRPHALSRAPFMIMKLNANSENDLAPCRSTLLVDGACCLP